MENRSGSPDPKTDQKSNQNCKGSERNHTIGTSRKNRRDTNG